jgi:hypothetical protein
MTMPVQRIALLAASLLVFGCAETVEYHYIGTDPIRNEQGHVIGHKDVLMDPRTGGEVEQVTSYVPMYDEKGQIVAYQEATRSGTVIRNLEGRRIGARYPDLRSRGTNPQAEGVGITIR